LVGAVSLAKFVRPPPWCQAAADGKALSTTEAGRIEPHVVHVKKAPLRHSLRLETQRSTDRDRVLTFAHFSPSADIVLGTVSRRVVA